MTGTGGSVRPKWPHLVAAAVRDNALTTVTLGIAAYVIVRGELVGYKDTQLVFLVSLLIAVLGLNALDSIVDRNTRSAGVARKLDSLTKQLTDSRAAVSAIKDQLRNVELLLDGLRLDAVASQFLHDQPEIPRDRFRRAGTIYWSGVTLRTALRQRLPDLGTALSHGVRLTILVVDPSSEQLARELVARENAKEEYIDGVLKSMILNLQVLAGKLTRGATFRLGFHQVFPTYGLTIIDPDEPDGICMIDMYHPDREACATFNVHATADAAWFTFFVTEFRSLLAKCQVTQISGPDDVEAAADSASRSPDKAGTADA